MRAAHPYPIFWGVPPRGFLALTIDFECEALCVIRSPACVVATIVNMHVFYYQDEVVSSIFDPQSSRTLLQCNIFALNSRMFKTCFPEGCFPGDKTLTPHLTFNPNCPKLLSSPCLKWEVYLSTYRGNALAVSKVRLLKINYKLFISDSSPYQSREQSGQVSLLEKGVTRE